MRAVVVLSVCAGLIVGCGANDAGSRKSVPVERGPVPIATASATNGIPEPSPADEWHVTTDPDTGITFALPGTTQRETKPGSEDGATPTVRQYKAEVQEEFFLTVNLVEAADGAFSADGLDFVADSLVAELRSGGADDAELIHRSSTVIDAHPVLDFRISFTAHTRKRSVWFARFIGDGARAVQLQTIAAVYPVEEAAATPTVEKYHQRLLDTVRMP